MAEFRATHRYARISATKVRPFADLIRGKTAQEGVEALRYIPNRGARFLEKVLKSAMANAENQNIRNVERLVISVSTAKFHVSSILSKLGVASRTEAVAVALQNKLVRLDGK